jgi:hypothetical protein
MVQSPGKRKPQATPTALPIARRPEVPCCQGNGVELVPRGAGGGPPSDVLQSGLAEARIFHPASMRCGRLPRPAWRHFRLAPIAGTAFSMLNAGSTGRCAGLRPLFRRNRPGQSGTTLADLKGTEGIESLLGYGL